MIEHELRCWPEYFQAVKRGRKPFEIRKEDARRFSEGDTLHLREWDPLSSSYTSDEIRVAVSYVLRGGPWLPDGYVCMGLTDRSAVSPPRAQETDEQLAAHFLAVLHQRSIAAREWQRQAGQLSASLNAERESHEKTKRQYLSAVHGRAKFREAFRKARAEGKAAREWMSEYAIPLLNELEGYQNDAARLALERLLGETHAALAVEEEAAP